MVTRRIFGGCALCAAVGLISGTADAQSGGVTRTMLRQEPVTGTNFVTIQMVIDLAPGGVIPRHTHPGHEATYVVEGQLDFEIDGQPKMNLKGGDSFLVPFGVPHGGKAGDKPTKLFATFVVDKDKPVSSPA